MEYLIIFVMIILTIKHFFLGGVSDGEGLIYGFSIIGSIWAFISLKEKDALKSIIDKKNELKWNRVLEKNSFVQEIVDEINSNYIRVIYVYKGHITIGEKEIIYSKKNLSDFSNVEECLYLVQNIKRKLKYKNLYEIEPIYKISGGNSSTLIGFTQTYNGDFVANYSDNLRQDLIGYKLVAHVRVQQSNNKRDNALKSWNN